MLNRDRISVSTAKGSPRRSHLPRIAWVTELLERDTCGNIGADVSPVQQRARQPLLIPTDQHRAARAGVQVLRVADAEIAARAWVLGLDQQEIGREGQAALRAADGNDLVRRSRGCRSISRPCWPNSGISSRNSTPRCARLTTAPSTGGGLARPRPLPAADEAGVRDGVVRRAERPVVDPRHVAGHAAQCRPRSRCG